MLKMVTEMTEITERAAIDVALDNGVLRGVAVLRRSGKSGSRTYTDRALFDVVEAINRESIKVYLDHSGKMIAGVRSVSDLVGSLRNARLDTDVVRADFAILPKYRATVEAMARDHIGGLSIHASPGAIDRAKGRETIESIAQLHSVDLVSETGSTISLLEAAPRATPTEILAKLEGKKSTFEAAIAELVADRWISDTSREMIRRELIERLRVLLYGKLQVPLEIPARPIMNSATPPEKGETINDLDFARALDRAGLYRGELPPEPERELTRTETALIAAFGRADGLEIK